MNEVNKREQALLERLKNIFNEKMADLDAASEELKIKTEITSSVW